MGTKSSLRYERDEATGQVAHLYEEAFDDEKHVYVALEGFQFEAASSMNLSGEWGPRLTVKLSNAWARKLGLIESFEEAPETGQETEESK